MCTQKVQFKHRRHSIFRWRSLRESKTPHASLRSVRLQCSVSVRFHTNNTVEAAKRVNRTKQHSGPIGPNASRHIHIASRSAAPVPSPHKHNSAQHRTHTDPVISAVSVCETVKTQQTSIPPLSGRRTRVVSMPYNSKAGSLRLLFSHMQSFVVRLPNTKNPKPEVYRSAR